MSTNISWGTISKDGLWNNNVVFAQMLALCPLLAVTGTATNGLGMGLATTFVLIVTSIIVSMSRGIISNEVRIPVFILLIAGTVTLVDLYMNAWMHDLYKVLGLFIPLIVTNCAILGRIEAFASKQRIAHAAMDGLMMGLGFTVALLTLGATREILGAGTLFANASLLLGDSFSFLESTIIDNYRGNVLLILPPGGFIALGFILAGKRLIDKRIEAKQTSESSDSAIAQVS